jgi:L-seryl-tRNA(Ser) seleniumtransferase
MTQPTDATRAELFRLLPPVDEVLRLAAIVPLLEREGHAAVADSARAVLEGVRREIAAGNLDETGVRVALSGLAEALERHLRESLSYSLRAVINATGVVLHTNLGRAPLSREALAHAAEVACGYSNLELDVENGTRGERDAHAQRLLTRLLDSDGHTASLVVNNNAAAVLLALNTLAEGGEVIVSRGELVEIGGSFRIPDVMTKSGAILQEVGTTNRTRISDYEQAITERTRLLLRVHRSNFQITGFTEQPSLTELVSLGRARNLPVMEDLGSGALFDLRSVGISGEPGVAESLRAGADVVTYSGDKLLGGPQAGLISGRRDLIARIRKNPLFRALRVDKLTYAALEATLLAYLRRDDSVPAVRMMHLSRQEIERRACALKSNLEGVAGLTVTVETGESMIGGGAAPAATLPTAVMTVTCMGRSADQLARALRQSEPPVIPRVDDGRVLLDLRTVFPEQDAAVERALRQTAENR